jgi:subtilisin-like proprotein convertase family protein
MTDASRGQRAPGSVALSVVVVVAVLALGATPYVTGAGQGFPANAGQTATDMTEIEMSSSAEALALFERLDLSSKPAERSGYLRADVTQDQLAALDRSGLAYEKGDSFVLIQSSALSGEASVLGSNGTNINIQGNNTVTSDAIVSGAPLGKTVIRADVSVNLKYPMMCDIYIMVFHPTYTMWTHIWNGNQHACTADLNQSFNGIHDFDFADINGIWHMQVQETNGQSTGYIDGWSIRLYYTSDATPTPTRTATPTIRKQFLPIIASGL